MNSVNLQCLFMFCFGFFFPADVYSALSCRIQAPHTYLEYYLVCREFFSHLRKKKKDCC